MWRLKLERDRTEELHTKNHTSFSCQNQLKADVCRADHTKPFLNTFNLVAS